MTSYSSTCKQSTQAEALKDRGNAAFNAVRLLISQINDAPQFLFVLTYLCYIAPKVKIWILFCCSGLRASPCRVLQGDWHDAISYYTKALQARPNWGVVYR